MFQLCRVIDYVQSRYRSFSYRQEGDIKRYISGQPDKEEAADTVYNALLPFLKVDECERVKGQLADVDQSEEKMSTVPLMADCGWNCTPLNLRQQRLRHTLFAMCRQVSLKQNIGNFPILSFEDDISKGMKVSPKEVICVCFLQIVNVKTE